MGVAASSPGPNLTSILCCKDRHAYPEHTLSNSDGPKENRDRDVFHRYGIHPTTVFSATDSGLLNTEKNSRPGSQYRLCGEGTNDKHDEGEK